MEKQDIYFVKGRLINFKTAKLAKEVKYNQEVTPGYFDSGLLKLTTHSNTEYTSAPTQSMLKNWLRDIYLIHINIDFTIDNVWIYRLKDLKTNLNILNINIYNSYEVALEEALVESLLIAKTKKAKCCRINDFNNNSCINCGSKPNETCKLLN